MALLGLKIREDKIVLHLDSVGINSPFTDFAELMAITHFLSVVMLPHFFLPTPYMQILDQPQQSKSQEYLY